MFIKDVFKSGQLVMPMPVGIPTTLQYNAKGILERMYNSVTDVSPDTEVSYEMFNALYSRVGVLGFIGPFFLESHINKDLITVQYPFTYAHELSHLLGVSNEAEANFWAYQVCVHSSHPYLCYSGYFGLLPYVLVNARQLLGKTDFEAWFATLRPEVIRELRHKEEYWNRKYSPFLGNIQDRIYDFYLKRNKIVSGKKNYAEVIGMVISVQENPIK